MAMWDNKQYLYEIISISKILEKLINLNNFKNYKYKTFIETFAKKI